VDGHHADDPERRAVDVERAAVAAGAAPKRRVQIDGSARRPVALFVLPHRRIAAAEHRRTPSAEEARGRERALRRFRVSGREVTFDQPLLR